MNNFCSRAPGGRHSQRSLGLNPTPGWKELREIDMKFACEFLDLQYLVCFPVPKEATLCSAVSVLRLKKATRPKVRSFDSFNQGSSMMLRAQRFCPSVLQEQGAKDPPEDKRNL